MLEVKRQAECLWKIPLTSKLILTEILSYDLIVMHVVTPNFRAIPELWLRALNHWNAIHANGNWSQHCSVSECRRI